MSVEPCAITQIDEWLTQFTLDIDDWSAIFKTLSKECQKGANVLPGALKMKQALATLQKLDASDTAPTLLAIQPVFREARSPLTRQSCTPAATTDPLCVA